MIVSMIESLFLIEVHAVPNTLVDNGIEIRAHLTLLSIHSEEHLGVSFSTSHSIIIFNFYAFSTHFFLFLLNHLFSFSNFELSFSDFLFTNDQFILFSLKPVECLLKFFLANTNLNLR
jgi:hypothetical protein